jgi:low affinity Fe/Cu permease
MVFLIQSTQNRDGPPQAELDDLIRAGAAQNVFIGIERLTRAELAKAKAEIAATEGHEVVNRKAARAGERATS